MVERDASTSSQHDNLEGNLHGAHEARAEGEERARCGSIGLDVVNNHFNT